MYVRPSAPSCKPNVKCRTVTSLQAQSFGGKARREVKRYSQCTAFYSHSILAKKTKNLQTIKTKASFVFFKYAFKRGKKGKGKTEKKKAGDKQANLKMKESEREHK